MAHRPPLMLGIGGLYGAIEWFGKIDRQLRALLNVRVATLYRAPYEAEVVELTFIIGYQTFASKFAKAMRLEPQGFSS
jgi:hypothetical protein